MPNKLFFLACILRLCEVRVSVTNAKGIWPKSSRTSSLEYLVISISTSIGYKKGRIYTKGAPFNVTPQMFGWEQLPQTSPPWTRHWAAPLVLYWLQSGCTYYTPNDPQVWAAKYKLTVIQPEGNAHQKSSDNHCFVRPCQWSHNGQYQDRQYIGEIPQLH